MNVLRAARLHIGRRGAFLAFLGLVSLALTVGLADMGRWDTLRDTFASMAYVPPVAWAIAWGLSCALCLLGSVAKQVDEWAFGVSALMYALWSMLYLEAWIDGTVPRAWTGLAVYAAFAGVILIVAGWPEVKHRGR